MQNQAEILAASSPGITDTLPTPVVQQRTSRQHTPGVRYASTFHPITSCWRTLVRRLGTGTALSTSSHSRVEAVSQSNLVNARSTGNEERHELDEIVVDRSWSTDNLRSSVSVSEHGNTPEKSGLSHLTTTMDREPIAPHPSGGFWMSWLPLTVLRYRIWPATVEFLNPQSFNPESEAHFRKETWFFRKVRILSYFLSMALTISPNQVPRVMVGGIFYPQLGPRTCVHPPSPQYFG